MNKSTAYPSSAKFFHWLMAIIIICMLFLGVSMVESLATWQITALALHKSLGVLVLVLVVLRLINRVFITAPALPTDLPHWQTFAGHLTHLGLYTAMIAMPLSGWLMQSADGRLVSVFGLFNLPKLIDSDLALYGLFREMHGFIAWGFVLIILMHVGAALYHGLIRKDHVLKSMLFSGKNRKPF